MGTPDQQEDSVATTQRTESATWPTSGGEMGRLIRTHDWAATPLGPIDSWPQSLRTLVDLVLDSTVMMSLMLGRRGLLIYNDAYAAGIGRRHPRALGASAFEVFPEAVSVFGPLFERALASECVSLRDLQFHFPPGERAGDLGWYDLTCAPVRDERGDVAGALAILVDTTERVLAEREHATVRRVKRASEARQAFLLALSDALRPLTDASEIQAAAARLLGEHLEASWAYYGEHTHPTTRMSGLPMASFDMLSGLQQGHTQLIDDVQTSPLVSDRTRARFGRLGMRALLAVPIRAVDGQLLAAVIVADRAVRHWTDVDVALVHDVADRTWAAVERARAETALRASEERFRALAETSPLGVGVSSVEGTILYTNRAFEAILGWEQHGLLGQPSTVVYHDPADRQAWLAVMQAHGSVSDYEVRFKRKDGSLVWVSLNLGPIEFGGRRGIIAVIQDATDRKQAEAERERLAVTEALAAERQALLKRIVQVQEAERASISREIHDSVTQLAHAAAIHLDNAVELLDGTPAPARAELERGRELTRAVASEARRLIAGLRPETLDILGLAGAVQQEVDALRVAGWRVDVDDAELACVRLNPEAEITLFRVAQEALSNVRKHAGRARVRVRLNRTNGSVRLEVRDWGRGFDPKMVTASSGGEHVGLVGMRERMDLAGGRLEVRSSPESGTTIRARLPISGRDEL